MAEPLPLRTALKRGALVAAVNGQVVGVQFAAETLLKFAAAVPILAGLFLAALELGADPGDLAGQDLISSGRTAYGALRESPAALTAFLAALALSLTAGAIVTFLAKAGSVRVLVTGEERGGAIERSPVRWAAVRGAAVFSIDRHLTGARELGRRYVRLGLLLLAAYAVTGAAYLAFLWSGMRVMAGGGVIAGWPFIALAASSALIVWITLLNLVYILSQMIMAVDDVGVRAAWARLGRFVYDDARQVAGIFTVVLLLMLLAGAAWLLAMAALGLIAFVPVAALAVLPLQLAAWLVRGLVFQYLALTAFTAYAAQYRRYRSGEGAAPARLRSA